VRIDLHTHSTASDGTLRPAAVIEAAAGAGLDVVALTDHDTAVGWPEASRAAERIGIRLVPGLEISTRMDGAGIHLLAYLPDLTHTGLAAELDRILAGRDGRLAAQVAGLRAAGVDITEADVRRQAGDSPAIGRPHLADVLIAKGVVRDRAEAFAGWLSYGMPGYVIRYATQTDEMVRLVTQAGGAAVIAHPWGRGSRRVLTPEMLGRLLDHGLVGIEVDHQDHTPADRDRLREIARDLGLVSTGSSDFHGAGKVDHDLGCHLTDPAELDRLLAAAAAHAMSSGRRVPEVVG
jgi:predicted metal-dependent phosphoesterase TrpH